MRDSSAELDKEKQMTKKLLTILTAAMLSQIGCHSLIHRPTDTPTQTFAKTATRVLLVVPTIAVSEMAILEAEQREGLYPRQTPEQREAVRQRRLEDEFREYMRRDERR
jgi:hypothetical protein